MESILTLYSTPRQSVDSIKDDAEKEERGERRGTRARCEREVLDASAVIYVIPSGA